MKILSKLLLPISFIGFLLIGFLLLTGHEGFSIKIANYTFILLLISILSYEK